MGRLDHAAGVLPLARHFKERIRFATKSTADSPNMPYSFNKTIQADLDLMLTMFERAHKGINMNLLTYRLRNAQSKVDACPRGMGGDSKPGRAWRFIIPHHLLCRARINRLEFLAILVSCCSISPKVPSSPWTAFSLWVIVQQHLVGFIRRVSRIKI